MQDGSGDYGADLRRWLQVSGLTQRALGRRAHISESYITDIKNSRKIPDDGIAKNIDNAVGAEGQFLAAVQRARRRRAVDQNPVDEPEGQQEDATDRRGFVGGLVAIAALAAETSRQIAGADPDPLTLAEVEDDVDRFALIYAATPHAELLPQVERRWSQVDRALAGRTTLAARGRLTVAAGRLSYFLSRLGFGQGDFTSARRLAVLAEQYARQTGDEVVLGSVAGMMSGIAYYRNRYGTAVTVFNDYPPDPPYLAARNAAYRARAYGRCGNAPAAKTALEQMRRSLTGGPPEPGDLPLGEAASWMFTASALSSCGEGEYAETFARRSVDAHEAAGPAASREEWAHALLTLAASLLHRERPVVDEAAVAATCAVDVIDGHPTHTVIQRAGDVAVRLHPHHRVPAVAALRERVAAAPRPALPVGSP